MSSARASKWVDELRTKRTERSSALDAAAKPKRFAWSESVVEAQPSDRMRKTDFERGSAGEAPHPRATGTLAPVNLPKERAAVQRAREEKKRSS